MRETCARVLAAALMTGVIAGVVAMSAIVGSPSEDGLPVAAPPPSVERSVHAVGLPAPRPHRTSVRRPVRAHPPSTPARPAGVARRLVIVHTRSAPSAHRRLASTKPKPKARPAAPAAPVPEPVAETQAPATTLAAAEAETGDDHGNGNAYGHDKDKDHGQGHEKHAE
jgi:hypothetical protein